MKVKSNSKQEAHSRHRSAWSPVRSVTSSVLVLGHLSSAEFVSYTDLGSGGTRMPRTSWERMAHYPIALPDPPCAEALNRHTRPLLDTLNANVQQCRTLTALRDLLLPQLLSAEPLPV